jgi:hypothetical protein
MDFPGAAGFIGGVHTSLIPSPAGRVQHLAFAAGLLLLTGCVTPSSGPAPAPTKVATLQAQPEPTGAITSPTGTEISCRIQMIDGKEVQSSDSLKTGHHRVIVALGSGENEHVGDVDLLIPAAKNYRLKAERNAEMFTLSLIEVETGKVAATSAALVDQVMKFKVFVGQK